MAGWSSRRLNKMCWLWCGGINSTHRGHLDLSAEQRSGARVWCQKHREGARREARAQQAPLCWSLWECGCFPHDLRYQESCWDMGKLRWWRFLTGPFTQHHSSAALFSFLPSLGLPEIWRHSCVYVNLWGEKNPIIFWLLLVGLGLGFSS